MPSPPGNVDASGDDERVIEQFPKFTVHAYEPEPYNFSVLKANCELNDLKNVELHNVAVSNVAGPATLYKSLECQGMHRLFPSAYGKGGTVAVQTETLKGDFDFLKVDVEGMEMQVLEGMNSKPASMVVEYVPWELPKPFEVLYWIWRAGYYTKQVDNHNIFCASEVEAS